MSSPRHLRVGFYIHGVPFRQGRARFDWTFDQLAHCPDDMSMILEHWLPLGDHADAARAQEKPGSTRRRRRREANSPDAQRCQS